MQDAAARNRALETGATDNYNYRGNVAMGWERYLDWKGRRVWMLRPAPASTRAFGEIMHVFIGARTPQEVELAIELDDGSTHTVRQSEKGRLWDLAE
jgi:hypothetical protein